MEKSSNVFKIEQDPPLQNKIFSFKNKLKTMESWWLRKAEGYGAVMDMGRWGIQFVLTGSRACPL